jgi:type I restriction enzyme, S subunit
VTASPSPMKPLSGTPIGLEGVPWPVAPLSAMFSHIDSRSVTGRERLLSITKSRGVVPRDEITDREARADTLVGYKRCRRGDIIVNQMSAFEGLLGVSNWDGIVTYHYLVFRPRSSNLDARFYAYLLRTPTYILDFSRRVRGLGGADQSNVRTPHIRIGDWLKTVVPAPPVATQCAIADCLDRETARIDALIAAKKRMADSLDERWQTVMHDAAAGRLTANHGPRRATSVPWLTDVPSHWREGQLKLIAQLGTGHTPSRSHPEWWVKLTIPWITTGEVAQMRSDRIEYMIETREHISELGMANSSARLHPAGTVVLCRTASAGYSAIMGRDMATSQDFATWTCGALLRPRFLLLCLRAMRQDLLGRLAMGSTHKTIYMPDIESIKVPIPPLDEQDGLVEAAYSEQRTLGQMSTALGAQIILLQERRQALITAAVTGQLAVPVAA